MGLGFGDFLYGLFDRTEIPERWAPPTEREVRFARKSMVDRIENDKQNMLNHSLTASHCEQYGVEGLAGADQGAGNKINSDLPNLVHNISASTYMLIEITPIDAAWISATGEHISGEKAGTGNRLMSIVMIVPGGTVSSIATKFKKIEEVTWDAYKYTHVSPKNVPWKKTIKMTKGKGNPAKYCPGIDVQKLEMAVWERGQPAKNGKPWKIAKFEDVIGAVTTRVDPSGFPALRQAVRPIPSWILSKTR
jgi:hypothetical protein